MQITGFDWDNGNTQKCQKHGVSIVEVEQIFQENPAIFLDHKHSESEKRYYAINKNKKGRSILIVFTYRDKDNRVCIRPISARYMHQKEIDHFSNLNK